MILGPAEAAAAAEREEMANWLKSANFFPSIAASLRATQRRADSRV